MRTMICGLIAFGALAVPASADDSGFVALTPEEIAFQAAPQMKGVEVALLHGNPNEPGFYVMRIKFAPGVLSSPHVHDQDRYATVISGTWHFGIGEAGTCAGTKPLGPGGFAHHPRGAVHYDGACGGETVVEISGMGPVKTVWTGRQ